MNLFIVNRFTGEATDDTKKEEQNKLSNVLNKINRRKKRKFNANTIRHVDKENEFQESELFKTDHVDYGINDDKNILKENELSEDEPEVKKTKVNDTSSIAGFSILGTVKFDTKLTVKRVLPKWLKNPIVLSADLQKLSEKFSKIDLDKKLKIKLKDNNIKYLFPVQAGFIPWQLTKSKQANVIHSPDVCVSAPTGSGKTLAFMIPLIQHLTGKLKNKNITMKAVRVLLVLPTQSLAIQIYNTFKTYTAETNITIGIITSAETTFKNEQKLLVTDNTIWSSTSRSDVVVCTAGRLIDHLKNTKGFDLQYLEYIVIDEADRVLDSMQDDWLRHLRIHLRAEEDLIGNNTLTLLSIKNRIDPQKLLFSATLSSDPEKLEKFSLFQPNLFTCVTNNEILIDNTESIERNTGKYTVPNELIEKITVCAIASKPLILYKLIMDIIKSTEKPKILIFVKEIHVAHRLSTLMCFMAKKSFTVKEISDQTPKNKRKELLESFSGREINVLICTDFIARGIDIPNVDCVISYNVPTHIKTYIHRAGRTARGGSSGVCITILETHEEKKFITMLETARINHKPIKKVEYNETDLEKLDTFYKKSLEQLKFKVKNHKRHILLKTQFKKQVLKTDRKCTIMN